MAITKELRIGLLVAITIVSLFSGFYFLKGANVFTTSHQFFAYFDNVQGLQRSAIVQAKGLQVGHVAAIELDGKGAVKVTLSVNNKTPLPKGTLAKLSSLDLLGTKGISLDLGNSTDLMHDNDVLNTGLDLGLMDKIGSDVTPLVGDVRKAVATLDSILTNVNGLLNTQTQKNLQASIGSLQTTMVNFSALSDRLNKQGNAIEGVVKNANSFTDNLAQNNKQINTILTNASNTTDHLAKAPIENTVKELQTASKQLNEVMVKINNGEGSVGAAINDKQLYNEINKTLSDLQALLTDLKAHPGKYINVTIFGRKAHPAE